MKKFILALLLLIAAITLISCGDLSPDTTEAPLVPIMVETASDYVMIYPLTFDGDNFKGSAIRDLESLVKENSGGAIPVKSDYLASGAVASPYEILLGPTNRPESKKAAEGLRCDDYVIGFVDGKLVVVGGSDEASAKAIRHFATMFFSKTQTNLVLHDNFYERFDGSYAVNTLAFFGKTPNDCGIVYDSSTKADALILQEGIRKLSGHELPLVLSTATAPAYPITVLSNEASLSLSDTGVVLSSNDAAIRQERVLSLLAEIEANGGLSKDSLGTVGESFGFSLLDLNVYSTGVGENSVTNRYVRLMKLLAGNQYPDVLTLQDVSPAWVEQFSKSGEGYKAMNEVYGYVGTGRNDDDDSVKNPVFYKKDKFDLIDSGTFWLSETPDFVSVGWDGRQRCVASWAILEEKVSKKKIAVISSMLDSYGNKARINGAALLVKKAAEFDCPVLLCGDMQAASNINYVKSITEYQLFDAQKLALQGDGYTKATVNSAFGTDQVPNGKSDFIFASYGDFKVVNHVVDRQKPDGGFVSNHWPLFAEFVLKSYTPTSKD